jgi:U3 small nucleolar ribonucleoprotein protein IMP4
MTIVTTSRKPVPEVRSLARDLAFALGCEYIVRGKQSIAQIAGRDPLVIHLSREGGKTRLQLITGNQVVADYLVRSERVEIRERTINQGIYSSNQSVYEHLSRYIPVVLAETIQGTLAYDGIKRRHYELDMVPYGA